MKVGDIYKLKRSGSMIYIADAASHINLKNEPVYVFYHLVYTEFTWGGAFVQYGTDAEIEEKYELFIPADKVEKYETFDELFEAKGIKL